MSGDGVRRLTAWSALVAVVVGIIATLLVPGDPPGFAAPPEQVLRWTLTDRRVALVGSVLLAAALVGLIVFGVGLRAMLGRAEGAPAIFSTVGYAALLVQVVVLLVAIGLAQVQAFVALDGDPATVKTLHEARFLMTGVAAVPGILWLVATGWAMVRSGFPARSAGWLAVVAAAVRVATVVSLARTGFLSPTGGAPLVGIAASAVWVVVVGGMFVVRPQARAED
jgi:hypothetical protein